MTELRTFQFNDVKFKVYGDAATPLFLTKDIAQILGSNQGNESKLSFIAQESDRTKVTLTAWNEGLQREVTREYNAVNEKGLYRILMRSNHINAYPFQDKVGEILVEIRKTGRYEAEKRELSKLEILEMALSSEKERLVLEAKVQELTPKAKGYDDLISTNKLFPLGMYGKIMGIGRVKFYDKLRQLKILMVDSTAPYQNWIDSGYFKCKLISKGIGRNYPVTFLTGKGMDWLTKKLQYTLSEEQTKELVSSVSE